MESGRWVREGRGGGPRLSTPAASPPAPAPFLSLLSGKQEVTLPFLSDTQEVTLPFLSDTQEVTLPFLSEAEDEALPFLSFLSAMQDDDSASTILVFLRPLAGALAVRRRSWSLRERFLGVELELVSTEDLEARLNRHRMPRS